jgi:hypothetical protein
VKIYYDTEFIEDGQTIELISIGMVADNGNEYYAINGDLFMGRLLHEPWHLENTVPSLPIRVLADDKIRWDPGHTDYHRVKSKRKIRDEVLKFIIENSDPEVELWAWYGAYDHIALCQLFGRMIELPYGVVPMWTNDLVQELHRKSKALGFRINLPQQAEGLHNALADARHLKVRADYLAKIDD